MRVVELQFELDPGNDHLISFDIMRFQSRTHTLVITTSMSDVGNHVGMDEKIVLYAWEA